MTEDSMTVTRSNFNDLLSVLRGYDAAIAAAPQDGTDDENLAAQKKAAADFIGSDDNKQIDILDAAGMRHFFTKLGPQDGTENEQHGDSQQLTAWRGQFDELLSACKSIDDGATSVPAELTSGDNQFVMRFNVVAQAA